MLRAAIERPIAISMLFLALVLIGAISYRKLPVDLLPQVTYPRLTVLTVYDDVPAEDLERLVTQPIEETVTALAGVRRTVSRSREGVSMVTVEYEWGTEMDFANLHLREAIDRVAFRQDFPEDADRPVILRWDPTSRPISILVLEGSDQIGALTDFATEVVKPALEQVHGVSQAEVVGGRDREILVSPDPERLAIYGIQLDDIRQALSQANVSFPGGKIRQGPLRLSLRIAGEYETLDDIRTTEIRRRGASAVQIGDVADVVDGFKEPEGHTLLADRRVVSLLVYKEPEANTIQVSESIDTALTALTSDYGDFGFAFIYRDADYVRASFAGLVQSLIVGGMLAFLVLFVFLSDARSPIVVGISIPVSITITFALLYFGDVKLNLMSLGGLSLAAGMLVDNAIVVLENVSRHLELRRSGSDERTTVAEAAYTGTSEVARAVAAATFTTIAVFFPVVYVPGIAGAFFRDQALTVTFSLLVSVAAALLLQPMLAARVLALRTGHAAPIFRLFQSGLSALARIHHGLLLRSMRRPVLHLGLLVLSLTVVAVVGTRLDRGFMPARSGGDLRLDIELPAGTPLEETESFTQDLARWIDSDPSVARVFTQVGRTEKTLAAMQDYAAPNTSRMRIILHPGRGAAGRSQETRDAIVARLEAQPGLAYVFRDEGIGLDELLASGESAFTLGVVSDDAAEALSVAETLAAELASVDGLTDIRIDRVIGTANVVAHLDRERILQNGLDPDRIAAELRNRLAGVEATTFNEVEQRIDIAVRLPRHKREDLTAALDSPIMVGAGETVPLRSFVTLSEERPVRELVRRDQRRMVSITADVSGRGFSDVWSDAMTIADEMGPFGGVTLVQGGEQAAMHDSFRDLGWAMVLAVLLVYMILAAQFESFLDPLLIAGVIPIGLAGSILAIAVTGNTINILSLIGVLALLGIAVNDAIVKVDTIRRLRAGGLPPFEAIVEGSRLRFRPILMTTVTTILAMLPMAIGLGSGEQLQRPLAITIIGGLALTTATTLIFTPILYMLAHRIRDPGSGVHETAASEESLA